MTDNKENFDHLNRALDSLGHAIADPTPQAVDKLEAAAEQLATCGEELRQMDPEMAREFSFELNQILQKILHLQELAEHERAHIRTQVEELIARLNAQKSYQGKTHK